MIAGGIGGSTGDMLMHSLDTVKTRQQGDPHIPPRYTSLGQSYYKIWRQEGIGRGLYGGWLPALGGPFFSSVLMNGANASLSITAFNITSLTSQLVSFESSLRSMKLVFV